MDICNQKESNIEEQAYLNLIKKVITTGNLTNDRTNIGTYSLFGEQLKFNLRKNTIPLFTTRKIFWRGIVEELLWMLSGSTNAKKLSEKGVHIWDKNSSREYLDKIGFKDRLEGDLGPIYGFQWRHAGAKYIDMNTDYSNQGIDQIKNIIYKIKNTPNDRRIILSSWNVSDIDKMALPPCHVLAQFYVANNELSCQLYQRSADLGLGVPFNICFYSLLTHILAHITNLLPGTFIHTFGNVHVYLNHVDALKELINRKPMPFPTLEFIKKIDNIDNIKFSDLKLINYKPKPKLFMEMAV